MNWRSVLPRLALAIAIAGAAIWIALNRDRFDPAHIEASIRGLGPWAPLAFVALYAIAAVLFAPGSILSLIGGALFGPFWGALVNLIGATFGATASHVEIYRADEASQFTSRRLRQPRGRRLSIGRWVRGEVRAGDERRQTRAEQRHAQFSAPHLDGVMNGERSPRISQGRDIPIERVRHGACELAFGVSETKPVAVHSSLRMWAGARAGLSAIDARLNRPMMCNSYAETASAASLFRTLPPACPDVSVG